MSGKDAKGRPNQRRRTRRDLMDAAQRLLEEGRKPTLDEVAVEAMVSRATAYRYFPNIDGLLAEAALDVGVPDVATFFATIKTHDPVKRLIAVDDMFAELVIQNEAQFRIMLSGSLMQRLEKADVPARQNRRVPMIEEALKPVRDQIKPATFDKLVQNLSILIAIEGVVVTWDVLQVPEKETRKAKRWAFKALVDAALAQGK